MDCRFFLTTLTSLALGLLCSCSSSGTNLASAKVYSQSKSTQVDNAKYYKVRTTAYSHVEADSLKYGMASAEGGDLKYGNYRSAAADWSVFPLGTVFKIEGLPWVYRIDDYGSALVGTKTIDLYKPNMAGISNWGARNVGIKILKWGSYANSYNILKDRTAARHVREMAQRIRSRNGSETASL
jgi:3D (Asp-Asp-Asp) domain-containing protein